MTRKTVKYKGEDYYYYYCRTGKKHGCANAPMVKESELIQCVQESLKGHIENIASLENILTGFTQEKIRREIVREYEEHIENCEKQIALVGSYKKGLYENLVNGSLSKAEYLTYKQEYSKEYDALTAAVSAWKDKIAAVLDNREERNRWINHFLQFSKMESIDRRAVVHLIRFIRVISKKEIYIEFSYADEYRKAAEFAEQLTRREAV